MTVPDTLATGNNSVLPQNMTWDQTGLEDFDASDAVTPRIKIVQREALWEENLSNRRFEELRFIALGLVKQRVLFHHNVEDNDVPMCKSSDFLTGYVNPETPKNKSFPWDISGFNKNDFTPDEQGNIKLSCEGCKLKEWGASPISDAPYCAEQWTLPIYYDSSGDGSEEWSPAILTLQKSSLKAIRTFLTGFKASGRPPFLSIGVGRLRLMQRGQVDYSVPTFTKLGDSPMDRWQEFSEQFVTMREYLTRPPIRDIEIEPAPVTDNTNRPPQNVVQGTVAPQAQPAPAPAPAQQTQPAQQSTQQQSGPISDPGQGDPWGPPTQTRQAPPSMPASPPAQQQTQSEPAQQAKPELPKTAPLPPPPSVSNNDDLPF